MFINTTGIVLREVAYGDNCKILTVLTGAEGKLTVSAYGAYRKNSKLAASASLLVFSHMTLTKRKDRWTLTEAQPIEQFAGLRDELELLSLGSYFAELTESVADEDSLNPELLPLCLNALYALSEKLKPPALVKLAFELRMAAIAGYAPMLVEAGEGAGELSPATALTHSPELIKTIEPSPCPDEGTMTLSAGALLAARYILTCNAKKLFSFRLDGKCLDELATATEGYLLAHLDRTFKTLDYYKKIVNSQSKCNSKEANCV